VSRAWSYLSRRFYHGSLVGFAAVRNWSSRSLRSATGLAVLHAIVLVATSFSRSIAYSGSGSTGSGRGNRRYD
jgi:hypothetical protein